MNSEINEIKVCVVVPVFNRINLTLRFIESFQKSEYHNYTLVIVDDGSTDGTRYIVNETHPDVVVLPGTGDLWWSGSTNVGVRYALENNYDYVMTINNDSEVEPDTLGQLVEVAQRHPKTIVGSRIMLDKNGTIWALGVSVDWSSSCFLSLNCFHKNVEIINEMVDPLPVYCLTGNGTLIPTCVFIDIGVYNGTWCPQYHGDTEVTIRARSKHFPSVVALGAIVYNNDFASDPQFSFVDELFSKKSHHYWKPICYIFLTYSPFKYKFNVVKQFTWVRSLVPQKYRNMLRRCLGKI